MPAGAVFSRRWWPSPLRLGLVTVLFAVTARAALALSDLSLDHVACIWLANGVVLGVMLMAPRRHWAAYLLAASVGNIFANWELRSDIVFTCLLTVINMFEIVVAAIPLRAALRRTDLSKRQALLPFLGYGVVLAPLSAAILASLTVYAFYGTPPLQTVMIWFAADALGIGIVTPVVVAVMRGQLADLFGPARASNTVLYVAVVTVVAMGVFSQTTFPLLFLIPPAMLFVASRLGHAGVALMVPLLALIALVAALTGHGPAALNTGLGTEDRVQITQLFVFSTAILSFWIASTETERRRITDELRISVAKLARLAAADGLTGLANRRSFDEALAREWRRTSRARQPLSIVLIDVDHFKAFNDCYGHLQGDDCLKRVAAAISSCVHRPADMAARYGGEEFVLLLPETDAASAALLAETVRAMIEQQAIPHRGSRTTGVVTASLGTATFDPRAGAQPDSSQAMLEQADRQMYVAKHLGRNRVSAQAVASWPLRVAV